MILGIGIDIEDISRFEGIMDKTKLFEKCFTEAERKYISSKKKYAQTACGIFCAKEAMLKALKTGLGGFPMSEIEINHEEGGAPYMSFFGKLKEYMKDKNAFVSISHCSNTAVAEVIIQSGGEN